MNIGKNIKDARRNAGLTQEQLAKKCNLATITIRQYELGKREPKLEQLSSLASALDVHVLDLLGYPARKECSVNGTLHFSVEYMAKHIARKYSLSNDVAISIVEECYNAMKMDGHEFAESSTMADLFDAVDSDQKEGIFNRLKDLIQENFPEESSDEH